MLIWKYGMFEARRLRSDVLIKNGTLGNPDTAVWIIMPTDSPAQSESADYVL